MGVTSPWHSNKNKNVYHNNTKCTEGNNIESENRVSGTGDLRICDHCRRLNDSLS